MVAVLAVAGVVAGTLSGAKASGRTTTAAAQASHAAAPAGPLQVVSVTQGGATTRTDGADPVRVTLSAPLAATSPVPVIRPAVPGTWQRSGDVVSFTPTTPFEPGTAVRVRFDAGQHGLRSTAGGLLASPVADHLRTKGWSNLRLKQLLAQLGYLPLNWTAQDATAPQPDNMATELAAAYAPPAGTFSWKDGYPNDPHHVLGGPSSLIMHGAMMAFESNDGLTMAGVMAGTACGTPCSRRRPRATTTRNGYTYALASKASPETLTIWHDGQVVITRWPTPASRPRPPRIGTVPVYLRYQFQIMRGTNPDGTKYADPVSWVSLLQRPARRCTTSRAAPTASRRAWAASSCRTTQAEQAWPYLTYGSWSPSPRRSRP